MNESWNFICAVGFILCFWTKRENWPLLENLTKENKKWNYEKIKEEIYTGYSNPEIILTCLLILKLQFKVLPSEKR